jgi:hypothetical protein
MFETSAVKNKNSHSHKVTNPQMQANAILADLDEDGTDSMSYGDEELEMAGVGAIPMPGSFGLMDLDLSDLSSSDADADLDFDDDGNKKPLLAPPMDTILEEDSVIEQVINDQIQLDSERL